MGYDEWDAQRDADEEAYADYLAYEYPNERHEGAIRYFLGVYGDAIDERLNRLQKDADHLINLGMFGSALVLCATGIEIIIKYFCVKPIVEGAFLSELWASELSSKIIGNRSSDQQKLLVFILKPWGIDLENITTGTNEPLWTVIRKRLLPNRQKVVHEGATISEGEAVFSLQCFVAMRTKVVAEIAKRFGFILDKTGCWCHVDTGWTPKDPFLKKN